MNRRALEHYRRWLVRARARANGLRPFIEEAARVGYPRQSAVHERYLRTLRDLQTDLDLLRPNSSMAQMLMAEMTLEGLCTDFIGGHVFRYDELALRREQRDEGFEWPPT